MGRGRTKGKKLTASYQDDPGSGEEEKIPVQKKRGRPLKPLKDEIDEDEVQKIEDEDSEDTSGVTSKDVKVKNAGLNGKKRKRDAQVKEKVDMMKEENGSGTTKPGIEDSKISNGFRQSRSRRKNTTPRRAAEAVLSATNTCQW